MRYIAEDFFTFEKLSPSLQTLIRQCCSNMTDAKWPAFVSDHNDRGAALLAIFHALETTIINVPPEGGIPLSRLIRKIVMVEGDRVYVSLDPYMFNGWKEKGANYVIPLPDGKFESGKIWFNHGGFGGSVHPGFEIQGFTTFFHMPRIQINYCGSDGMADIDLDGYSPINFFKHLTYANSDIRQWYTDRYMKKFSKSGFGTKNVGNVNEDDLKFPHTCSRRILDSNLDKQISGALRMFVQEINEKREWTGKLEKLMERDYVRKYISNIHDSILIPIVDQSVVKTSSRDELSDFYRTSVILSYFKFLTDSMKVEDDDNDDDLKDLRPVMTRDELKRCKKRLRAELKKMKKKELKLMSASDFDNEKQVWWLQQSEAKDSASKIVADTGPFQFVFTRDKAGTLQISYIVPKLTLTGQ